MPTYIDRVYIKFDFDTQTQFYGVEPDPAALVSRLWISPQIGKAWGNAWGYNSSQADSLFNAGGTTIDVEKRRQAYYEVQELMILNDIATIPIWEMPMPTVWKSEYRNFPTTARCVYDNRELVWWERGEVSRPVTPTTPAPTGIGIEWVATAMTIEFVVMLGVTVVLRRRRKT
jgi:ABC-type transport system substrate-binding protein